MAENDNKSIRLMKSEISTLTPLEKEVIGSIVRGHGNLPDKMEGEEYDKLLQEVVDAEVRMMKRQPLSDRQREILLEESKCFDNGIEGLAKEMHVDADFLKASLGEHKYKPYTITIGTDNRPGGVEGEYHVKFKPDIMTVTFGEQEEVAKEFGGTMRVTNGQEWADFYREDEAVKFAEKVVGMNMERELQARFDAFKAKHGEEPLYAEVTIRWKDDGTEQEHIIKLSDDIDERDDDKVFFNVTGLNDLKSLINPDNGEDFYIVDVQNITFQPKSLFLNDEKAVTVEQIQKKAVKLFGNNFEFDYWNETEAGTKIDRVDLGEMPDTISIDKLEIKDGKLSLYSNDIGGDVDLQAMDDIELSKVDISLDEIKGYLDTQKLHSGIDDDNKEKNPQIPTTKEELIALVGNDYKRETNFGALFVTETEDYGRKESRKVSGISIRDNNIQFMGIHAPKSWEALTPDGQKKVCQWVHDNLELTRQLPDMFYHALDVLKDAETATGKQKEGYNMFQRLINDLYLGESTYDPYYQFWAGKVSNDFRYFIQPTELEKSSHYKELADALAIMPRSDIEKFAKEVENHPQRKVMCMEIDNQNNLRESKGNLRNVLDNAKIDLGNTYKISPLDINMGNWTAHVDTIKYNPEFELDYYVASGIDKEGGHSNILIHKLDNMTSIGELTKAVHEAHVKNLEQGAKQAIRDRIVTPSARSFTPDQVEVLNHYHQVAAPDKPAGEVFKELLDEVAQEPDVARKPEKWVTDTAKELDDLAEGITRDQSRGIHI